MHTWTEEYHSHLRTLTGLGQFELTFKGMFDGVYPATTWRQFVKEYLTDSIMHTGRLVGTLCDQSREHSLLPADSDTLCRFPVFLSMHLHVYRVCFHPATLRFLPFLLLLACLFPVCKFVLNLLVFVFSSKPNSEYVCLRLICNLWNYLSQYLIMWLISEPTALPS